MSTYRASMDARQRQTRAGRLTRHSIFTMKRPITFQVRKSLVEYVDVELADMQTSVFYQRIFILAKNAHLTPEESETETIQAPDPALVDLVEAVHSGAVALEFKEDMIIENDDMSQSAEGEEEEEVAPEAPTEPSEVAATEPEKEVLTHTFRFSEYDIGDEESAVEEDDMVGHPSILGKPKDFFDVFSEVLLKLHEDCKEVSITPDPMCGLYVHMGDYSLLMLESSEDMMGCFTRALAECSETYWLTNRVFQIEDHITELYTKELLFRRIPAVFLNEKFPTSTPTDEYLMGKQHLIIKEKLRTICRLIWEANQGEPDGGSQNDSINDEDDNFPSKVKTKVSISAEQLPVDIYRKHMPEIQRIELVLASTRFYYELDGFAKLYGKIPFARDEEGLFWPIPNNYTPPHIFRRTPYDINLTFADYASIANQKSMSHMSENSGGEVAAEEEAPPKGESPPKTD